MFDASVNLRIIKLLAIGLLLLLSSCKNDIFRQKYDKLKSSKVEIPNNLLVLKTSEDTSNLSINEGVRLVHYISQYECSECAIAGIYRYEKLYELSKETNKFKLLIIISTPPEVVDYMIGVIKKECNNKGIIFPIYVDANNEFFLSNPQLPADPRLHTFLIDTKGVPIIIGNPLDNKKIWSLYVEYLYSEQPYMYNVK